MRLVIGRLGWGGTDRIVYRSIHERAYQLKGHGLQVVSRQPVFKYSAGGFRDFTRMAASDPVMWGDIFLNNKDAVLEMLGRFTEDRSALQRAIRWGEAETLETLFRRTRDIRRGIIAAGQDEPEHLKKS